MTNRISVEQHLTQKTYKDANGCIIYAGRKNTKGYGRIRIGKRDIAAHRVAYEVAYGPIPVGYQIDHLCRVRACINVEHLEAVTPKENNARSNSPSAINSRRTHCMKGHEFTPETTGRNYRGKRVCLVCKPPKNTPAHPQKGGEG